MSSLYFFDSVQQLATMLENSLLWLDKAVEHAAARPFDAQLYLQARLAPDQYPLVRQIQSSCDNVKFAAARLTGKTAPAHPDTEATIDELRIRIKAVVEYVRGFKQEDFEGAADRTIQLPFLPGKGTKGYHYLIHMVQPNFYFHITTAYAILRHSGVNVGKFDYIGRHMPLFDV